MNITTELGFGNGHSSIIKVPALSEEVSLKLVRVKKQGAPNRVEIEMSPSEARELANSLFIAAGRAEQAVKDREMSEYKNAFGKPSLLETPFLAPVDPTKVLTEAVKA